MISIDLVYKTVLVIANSDVRGNIVPKDIRLIINNVVNEIYETYFFDINRVLNRQNRGFIGRGIENLPNKVSEKINYFLVEDFELQYDNNNGYFSLPDDIRYFESLFYKDNEIEVIRSNSEFKLVKPISKEEYPIFLQVGNIIKIAPNTITSDVRLSYLRNPKIANWTYVVVGNTEVFNPSANDFQDIDLHPSEQSNVILKTLQSIGINLKEQDLQKVTFEKENIEFNKDNTM